MAERGSNNNSKKITYLGINSHGFLHTKATKEEWEEDQANGNGYITRYTYEVTENGEKVKKYTYHNEYKGGSSLGKIVDLEFRATPFNVQQLRIKIESEGFIDVISVNLINSGNGSINQYVESIALVINNVDFNKKTRIVPYAIENKDGTKRKDGSYYKNLGVAFRMGDEKDANGKFLKYPKTHEWKDVPAVVKTQTITGAIEKDYKARKDFIFGLLKQAIDKFEQHEPSQDSHKDEVISNQIEQKAPSTDNGDDDLPF